MNHLLTIKCMSLYVSGVSTKKPKEEEKQQPKPVDLNLVERPMTPRDLAVFLQVSPITIRRLMQAGKLPFFRLGQRVRFMPSAVLEALKTPSATPTPASPSEPKK